MFVEAKNKKFGVVFISFSFIFPTILTKALVCDGLKTTNQNRAGPSPQIV